MRNLSKMCKMDWKMYNRKCKMVSSKFEKRYMTDWNRCEMMYQSKVTQCTAKWRTRTGCCTRLYGDQDFDTSSSTSACFFRVLPVSNALSRPCPMGRPCTFAESSQCATVHRHFPVLRRHTAAGPAGAPRTETHWLEQSFSRLSEYHVGPPKKKPRRP